MPPEIRADRDLARGAVPPAAPPRLDVDVDEALGAARNPLVAQMHRRMRLRDAPVRVERPMREPAPARVESEPVAALDQGWIEEDLPTAPARDIRTPAPAPTAVEEVGRARPSPISTHYETLAADTWRVLRRRLPMLLGCALAGLVLGALLFSLLAPKYTASAVVQLGFSRPESNERSVTTSATTDAINLVESEARLLKSKAIARRVASRLDLAAHPEYTTPGFMTMLEGLLSPSRAVQSEAAALDLAAEALQRELTVRNDARSYLIVVEAEAREPEWAATVANAFAYEYLAYRTSQQLLEAEASARMTLRVVTQAFSESHPQVLEAARNLRIAEARARDYETTGIDRTSDWSLLSGHSLMKAEAGPLPTAPSLPIFLGLGGLAGLFAALGFAMYQERRTSGLRSEREVLEATGAPCLGMIPRVGSYASAARKLIREEALRSLCVSAGLGSAAGSAPKVVLTTSALPDSGGPGVVRALSRVMAADGKRVLVINLTPASHTGTDLSLDDLLEARSALSGLAPQLGEGGVVTLRRKLGLAAVADGPYWPADVAAQRVDRLVEEALEHFDVVLIETPPALLFLEATLVAARADVSLFFAQWNHTPSDAVADAVARLDDHGVRVDGVVLTQVDLDLYQYFVPNGRTYYVRQYQKFYERLARA